ncbi:MAG: hypothetical protein GY754_02200 [bacterium]|nr:hypothetical protein [bacterium]
MKESELIFGLMATFGKAEYSIADLNHLIAPFNINEACLRTNLSRMSAKGIIKKLKQDGKKVFYGFDRSGESIKSNVARGFYSLGWSSWDNSWWGILFSVPNIEKSKRYDIRKKLSEYRFASLYPGFWIRPLNPAENLETSLADIFHNDHCKAIRFSHFDDISTAEVSSLWKLDDINKQFEYGLTLIEEKRSRMHNFNPEQALVEKMIVGDTIVNILFSDPLLPGQFLPNNWKGEPLKKEFFSWNKEITEISRAYWSKVI